MSANTPGGYLGQGGRRIEGVMTPQQFDETTEVWLNRRQPPMTPGQPAWQMAFERDWFAGMRAPVIPTAKTVEYPLAQSMDMPASQPAPQQAPVPQQAPAPQQVAASPRPAEFAPPQKWWLHSDRAIEAARKKRDEWSPIEAAIDDFHDRGHDIAAANWRGQVDLWRAVTNTPEIRYNATPEQMTPSPEARRILDMGFKEYAKTLSHEDRFAFNRFTYGKREEDFERRYGPRLNDWVKFHAWRQSQRVPEQQAPAPGVGNVPQPPAAGQSAPGTLTPEQMQQMGSPSPDARRYDGLNYKSNNVVSASRAVGDARGRMGGSAVGRKQSEAISQMTRIANGMAEGRGGQQYRDAVAAFEAAIASGDQTSINAAESNLSMLLSPMLDKFDARFKGEVGDIGIDIRKQFMDTLRGRIQAGTAGTMRGMPMQSAGMAMQSQGMPGAPQVRGPQAPTPRRPGASGASAPAKPMRTPTGLSIHEFGSMKDVMDASAKGGTIQSGDLVKIAGSNFTAVPSFDQYGNPEWGFVPAVVFGGGGSGSPEMAIPDPFSMPVDAWGDSLSEAQRQTMIDTLLTDPRMRSSLDRATLEQIDAVRRSRQGLLRSPMSAKDRESAVARLKAEENAALHSAMASVASKAQGAALFASDYADQVRAREQEDAQNKLDMELEKQIRLAEANAIIGEQRDEAKADRERAKEDRNRAITAAMDEQKRVAEAERNRIASFKVPLSSEAATAYVESGGLMKADASQAVAAAWNSLDDQQKQLAVDLLTDFAEAAPDPPRMQLRLRNGELLTGEMDWADTKSSGVAQTISVQSGINPESHLPERDLIRLFESIRGMPTPPAATMQQTDADDPTKEFEQSSLDARREYETKVSEWQKGVQKILTQDRPPQYSAEYYRENPDAATMVQKRFGDWETQSFKPAVAAARDSGDLGQLRETLGDLYSWVVVMENAGHSTNYQEYPGVDMNNGRAAFVESIIKAMGTSK